jgi:hypothetical protein
MVPTFLSVDASTLHFAVMAARPNAFLHEMFGVTACGNKYVYVDDAAARACLSTLVSRVEKLSSSVDLTHSVYITLFGVTPAHPGDEPYVVDATAAYFVAKMVGVSHPPEWFTRSWTDYAKIKALTQQAVNNALAYIACMTDAELWSAARRAGIVNTRIVYEWPTLADVHRNVLLRDRRVDARLFICRRIER